MLPHVPGWAAWLIATVPILLILGVVLYFFGGDGPRNDDDEPDGALP